MATTPRNPSDRNWSKESSKYQLLIQIKRAVVSGGGLSHDVHIQIEIDGEIVYTTSDQQAPYVWNESFSTYLHSLDPSIPSAIVVTAYKKRWTSPGYKIVGSRSIPLADLVHTLNKGEDEHDYHLVTNKRNLTLHGNVIISFDLRDKYFGLPTDATSQTGDSSKDGVVEVGLLSKKKSGKVQKSAAAESKRISIKRIMYELMDDAHDWFLYLQNSIGLRRLVNGLLLALLVCLVYLSVRQWRSIDSDLDAMHDRFSALESSIVAALEAAKVPH